MGEVAGGQFGSEVREQQDDLTSGDVGECGEDGVELVEVRSCA